MGHGWPHYEAMEPLMPLKVRGTYAHQSFQPLVHDSGPLSSPSTSCQATTSNPPSADRLLLTFPANPLPQTEAKHSLRFKLLHHYGVLQLPFKTLLI
jgi:hypothetical protein